MYVVVRIDISFAVALLSSFASAPAQEHYLALKNILKYLRHTKAWGILYWRGEPVTSLPKITIKQPPLDPLLPSFPQHPLLQLVGFVDAAYATDTNTRCSLTGIVFCLAGGALPTNPNFKPLSLPVQLRLNSLPLCMLPRLPNTFVPSFMSLAFHKRVPHLSTKTTSPPLP